MHKPNTAEAPTIDVDATVIPAVDKSIQAEAAADKQRVTIPINLDNWRHLSDTDQAEVLWFHQHILDERLTWNEAKNALGKDRSTLHRVLRGNYNLDKETGKHGSWAGILAAIRSYRKIAEQRAQIQRQVFAHNSVSRMVFAGLDYALANNSLTTIIGESRSGKTTAAEAWAVENNHGRSIFIRAQILGGLKRLLQDIADKVGVSTKLNMVDLDKSIQRALNGNRILIIDEAHRLMPCKHDNEPVRLEYVRDLRDLTGCAVALVATARFDQRLRDGSYQFEQFLGRIGMPIRIPKRITQKGVLPIVEQFIAKPSPAVVDLMLDLANKPGRLGIVVETLKIASKIAANKKEPLEESHVLKAHHLRSSMAGQTEEAD